MEPRLIGCTEHVALSCPDDPTLLGDGARTEHVSPSCPDDPTLPGDGGRTEHVSPSCPDDPTLPGDGGRTEHMAPSCPDDPTLLGDGFHISVVPSPSSNSFGVANSERQETGNTTKKKSMTHTESARSATSRWGTLRVTTGGSRKTETDPAAIASMFGGRMSFRPSASANDRGRQSQLSLASAVHRTSVFTTFISSELRCSAESIKSVLSDMVFFNEVLDADRMASDASRFADLISFPNEDLLRGAPWYSVMNSCASVFGSSEGSAATYKLSEQVEHVDFFISHNWCTPRSSKFLALALYFNLAVAFQLAFLMSSIVCVLSALGYLPVFMHLHYDSGQGGGYRHEGPPCLIACFLTFWITIFFRHEIVGRMCKRGQSVFLDKVCINQMNPDLKKQGISSLCAYLHNSKRMLVVYSDTYLAKLWTVYEVASFLLLHPAGTMVVFPVRIIKHLPAIAIGFMLYRLANYIAFLSIVYESVAIPDFGLTVLVPMLGVCGMLPACHALRALSQQEDEIFKRVSRFNLRDVKCFDEADRPVVYRNIATLMKSKVYQEDDKVAEEVCLDSFNSMARQELPKVLHRSHRVSIIRYRFILLVVFPSIGAKMDDFASRIISGAGPEASVILLSGILWTFVVWPLLFAALCAMCHIQIQIKDTRAWFITAISSLVCVGITMLAWYVEGLGVELSMQYPAAFGVYLVAGLLCSMITVAVYRNQLPHESPYDAKVHVSDEAEFEPATSTDRGSSEEAPGLSDGD